MAYKSGRTRSSGPPAAPGAGRPAVSAPRYWKRAVRELGARDPVIGQLAGRHPGSALCTRGDAFQTLARSIVGQQISVQAAQTVWNRLAAAVPQLAPGPVAAAGDDVLRGCGLSARKVLYLRELATHFADGRIDTRRWARASDDQLIAELTALRGIGRWTAEMFLIFHLTRPDVLPLADLGLQRAMSRHYNRGRPIGTERMRRVAACWQPWRTVATWYLWRSLDPIPVEY
jgi:DNA-3-methyladenine glycosylase II